LTGTDGFMTSASDSIAIDATGAKSVDRIIAELLVERRTDRVGARASHQKGISIRICASDSLHADRPAGANDVFDEKEIDAALRTLPKGIHRAAVMAELAAIRRDKVWVTRSEVLDGAVGIAAPYFDNANRVVGSIIVFGPELRFDEARIARVTKAVLESTAELSSALGQVTARRIQRPAKKGERNRLDGRTRPPGGTR
jgi:hypothetical protein